MSELEFLKDLVIVFGAAIVVVTLLERVRVPSIAGFIIAGVLVGPGALGLIADVHQVETLAEFGVVLLLFGIGLELSLDRIRRLWRAVLFGGAIQVCATILAVFALSRGLGLNPERAVFLGFVVAISSTAIVLRGLSSRGELEAPHGRLAVGILIFQDLCVVPMILVLPFLAGAGGSVMDALLAVGIALAVLAGVLLATRLVVPPMLRAVSNTRQRDLFVLAVALVCMGTAWIASMAGISVALGAFLAGLVVSGSEYRHQALSDLIPLREVLASVFFVSVGMLLDTMGIAGQVTPILGLLLAILAGKFLIVFATAAVMRLPLRVCVLTAAALCQVGEFSFVLINAARGTPLVAQPLSGNLTVAVILSMLITPFALRLGPRLAAGAGKMSWLTRLLSVNVPEAERSDRGLEDHTIVAGYGVTGQELASCLAASGTPHMVVDLNSENVRLAARRGVAACFGDVTSLEVLEGLGVKRARELVVAVNDPDAAARAVRAARGLAPELRIIVRAIYVDDIERLLIAGASEVVAAEAEAAVEISARILKGRGTDPALLEEQACRIRARRKDD
jgi:CPA2 family monovalent cation:H+ antiporter-2